MCAVCRVLNYDGCAIIQGSRAIFAVHAASTAGFLVVWYVRIMSQDMSHGPFQQIFGRALSSSNNSTVAYKTIAYETITTMTHVKVWQLFTLTLASTKYEVAYFVLHKGG